MIRQVTKADTITDPKPEQAGPTGMAPATKTESPTEAREGPQKKHQRNLPQSRLGLLAYSGAT